MLLDRPARWLKTLQCRLEQLLGGRVGDRVGQSSAANLMAQNQFLQQIVDNSPGSIYVKDREGRFLIANQAAAAVHGTTVAAMLGKREIDFNPNVPLKQHEAFLTANRAVMETRQSIQNELQAIVMASGELRWYQTSISPIYDLQGQVLGIIGNSIDVTALKQMQDELQRLASIDAAKQKGRDRMVVEHLFEQYV